MISQCKDHYVSVDQARFIIYIVAKYLDTNKIKEHLCFHKTTLPHDAIFTKEDSSTSDELLEVLSRKYNSHYRACMGSLIYPFVF